MSKNLHVTIDKDSGFCFGVVYAIDMAEEILGEDGYLYCLGDIVHNDEEVARLKAKGLRIISHSELPNLQNEKVLIRAHGEAPETYKTALENNITLIDASCPVVLKLQNRIKTSFDSDEAIVFQDIAELDSVDLPSSFTLYSQTTKSVDRFYEIKDELIRRGYEVKANDTICRQVSNRYEDLGNFAKQYDKIVFVSGKKSSNGKVLFDVCKNVNPNTFFVSDAEELDPQFFGTNETVGICGATSTPMWLMEKIKDTIESF